MKRQVVAGMVDSEKKWKVFSYSLGVFVTAFLVAFFAGSLYFVPREALADTNSSSAASADGYTLSLSATSAINLGITVSDSDTMTVEQGSVSVITTSPGYELFISMSGDSTALNGIAEGISGSIAAVNGSVTAPAALTRGTWGYAIPGNTTNLVSNGFNTSYSPMSSTTPDTSKKFATSTAASSPQMIASSGTSTTGDNYPVFYAVRANSSTAPGDYSNTVMFTAVADAAVSDTLTLTPSSVNINTATTVTVKTSLYSTAGYANANIYFLTAAEKNSIVGTNVEALGKTPLTCSKTSNTPVTYSCSLPSQTTPGTYYVYAKFPTYDKAYSAAFTVINPTYTVTVTNSNTTSGAASVQVPLNGSATVTVTPTSGYYLSAVSCPSGYTCTGYSTGITHTGQQTVTVTNNNTLSGGTLTLTGAALPFNGITKMQQMTSTICNNASIGESATLTDTRDTNTYTVAKLADGNCWMTQNLRLGDSTKTITLTSTDSNVTTSFVLPQAQTVEYGWWSDPENPTDSKHVFATGNTNYGNIYNWLTATAGTGHGSMSSTSATNLNNASASICPKGWRLPDGGQATSKSWYALDRALGGTGANRTDTTQRNKFMGSPYNFVYSGCYFFTGMYDSPGSWGLWWSRSADTNAATAYIFSIDSNDSFEPQTSAWVGNGAAVRCVAQ